MNEPILQNEPVIRLDFFRGNSFSHPAVGGIGSAPGVNPFEIDTMTGYRQELTGF